MSFETIVGQPFAVGLCRAWLKQNTTNPLLLYGPEGVGKKSLGLETAKALNCATPWACAVPFPMGEGADRPGEATSCDTCISCRKISAGHHPDVRVIDLAWQAAERGEPIEKQQSLRIETIMTERQRLLQSPGEGSWKVSIIDDAHRLTPDAANVLLKILEEPPAHTAIFLVTPFRDRLFATIVSRCQPVRFRTLSDEEMGRCLTHLKVPADMHAQLMEMALGSPGRALHLNREEQIEAIQGAERLWQTLGQMTPARVMQESGARKTTKPNRAEIEGQIHSLLMPAARALRAGEPGAKEPVRAIQSALTQLRQNVQPALVYDYLLLQLAKAKK